MLSSLLQRDILDDFFCLKMAVSPSLRKEEKKFEKRGHKRGQAWLVVSEKGDISI